MAAMLDYLASQPAQVREAAGADFMAAVAAPASSPAFLIVIRPCSAAGSLAFAGAGATAERDSGVGRHPEVPARPNARL